MRSAAGTARWQIRSVAIAARRHGAVAGSGRRSLDRTGRTTNSFRCVRLPRPTLLGGANDYQRFRQSSNVVLLDPDVSDAFPNSAAVNQALRALATVARKSVRVTRRPSSPQRRPKGRMLTRSAKARRRGPRS